MKMTDQESISKSTVSISLPRAFYDFYMANKLWEEFSSFSDWIRHAVRKDRELWAARIYSKTLKNSEVFQHE